MLKLRKILLCNYLYYIIFLIAILYFFISTIIIKKESQYKVNDNIFKASIINYKIDGNVLTMIIKGKEKIQSTYYIKSKAEKEYLINNLKYGQKLELTGNLSLPSNNTIPNTFNYKKYLNNHQIYYLLEIENLKIGEQKVNIFYQIKYKISKYLKSFDNYDYLLTFVLGNKNYLDYESIKNYQILGVSHLFAISGMHISLFATCLLFILKKFKVTENKRYLITMIFLLFYIFLTNFSPSVLRATLFFTLLSLNKIYYTFIKTINIYLLTISILILINPYILYDLGAQYSLLTSFGLILFTSKLNTKNYFINLFKVSLVAFLFSLPITAINFYSVNLLSVFNNLIFVPLISVIIYPFSLIVIFLPFLEFILTFLINILELLGNIFSLVSIDFLIPKVSFIFWIIYYLTIIMFYKKNKYLIITFSILILNRYSYLLDNNSYVYFLDVGQGDSALLIAPKRKEVIMIDTGGKLSYQREDWKLKTKEYHLSDNTITFMKSLGINTINLLLITHGDDDHAGETINLINNFKIQNIILNKNNYNNLELKILNSNLVVKEYYNKYFNYQILNTKIYNDENKDSLISYFNINDIYFLFLGDASKNEEKELINNHLKVDFLKIGHHGSNTSTSEQFINSINPQYCIISVGKNNKFGHPKKQVLNILQKCNIYRTDTNGSIEIKLNTSKYEINTYSP